MNMDPPQLPLNNVDNGAIVDVEFCPTEPETLVSVLKKYGYAHLTNHGIQDETIDECFTTTRNFFSLPSPIKDKYAKSKTIVSYQGYNAKSDSSRGNNVVIREYFHALGGAKEMYDYPVEVPEMEPAIQGLLHGSSIRALNGVLLQALGSVLSSSNKLIDNFLDSHKSVLYSYYQDKKDEMGHQNYQSYSYFSSMFYPCLANVLNADGNDDKDESVVGVQRCSAHTDCSTYTLLFLQDEDNALQKYCKVAKTWVNIKKLPRSILLIPGDALETFSSGEIPALVHRVPTSSLNLKARQSLPVYILPDSATPFPIKAVDNDESDVGTWTFGQHYEKLIADRYFK